MTVIFEGKYFAVKKEKELKRSVDKLRIKGITPKLVSVLVGDNPASVLYVSLKEKAAQRIGAKIEVQKYDSAVRFSELVHEIKKLNEDKNVHGIMIQLPLPKSFSKRDRDEIINSIERRKDVDGLRDDSSYLTPTAKAVLEVIKEATPYITLKDGPLKVVVIGAKGFEGKKILTLLKERGYDVVGVDKDTSDLKSKTRKADVLVSVTGSPRIIGKDDIKVGSVVIDVGSPKGDVRSKEILGKAAFISPVPGGVGPVTISCLLENLIEAAEVNHRKG